VTADDYLHWVGFELHDLPWRMRRDLLAELREHLAELPEGTNFSERLGPPMEYAAELRVAAGLERRHGLIALLRRPRPRNLVLVALGLTVLGLVIGAIVWVDSYQPLTAAGTMANPVGVKEDTLGGVEWVVFHQGRSFRFGIDIRNAGSRTVRVVGVPYGPYEPFKAQLLVSGPSHGGTVMPMTRFHPFDLPPGQIRFFMLRGVYHYRCPRSMRGIILSLDQFPVRFSFLWRTSTTWIPLPEPLRIVFRKDSCSTR
jgi:hypothetical protein